MQPLPSSSAGQPTGLLDSRTDVFPVYTAVPIDVIRSPTAVGVERPVAVLKVQVPAAPSQDILEVVRQPELDVAAGPPARRCPRDSVAKLVSVQVVEPSRCLERKSAMALPDATRAGRV